MDHNEAVNEWLDKQQEFFEGLIERNKAKMDAIQKDIDSLQVKKDNSANNILRATSVLNEVKKIKEEADRS